MVDGVKIAFKYCAVPAAYFNESTKGSIANPVKKCRS